MFSSEIKKLLGRDSLENTIPSFGVEVLFSDGALSIQSFKPSNLIALWILIQASVNLGDEYVFFEIEREDIQLKFHGVAINGKFCLFQNLSSLNANKLFGDIHVDLEKPELIQIEESRWGHIFFLPKSAFVDFNKMIQLGTDVILAGEPDEFFTLHMSQLDKVCFANILVPSLVSWDVTGM